MMYLNKSISFGLVYLIGGFFMSMSSMLLKSNLLTMELVNLNSVSVGVEVLVDKYSLLFGSTVMIISGMVLIYSNWYMNEDQYINRFCWMINLFVLSMLFLVFIPNLVALMIGWDGLGVTSFLLIVYYQNHYSYKCGLLTFMTNRLGDMFMLVSMTIIINCGVVNYLFIMNEKWLMFMILVASMTKSAQIPFSSWLPAAMAAPTPVSALVHSSTLVTAGVYLLIRFSWGFENMILLSFFMYMAGMLTMILSGLSALLEVDIKKLIALSTLSQLGLMFVSLSLGLSQFAFFHLLSHASFKATLFLCAGVLIHMNNNCQDIRFLANNSISTKMLVLCMNCCNLSLCGFPFLAGYYSKDIIIESSLSLGGGLLNYVFLLLGVMLTVGYSTRLFICNSSVTKMFIFGKEEGFFLIPIMFLSVLGVTLGNFFIASVEFVMSPMVLSCYDTMGALVMLVLGGMLGSMSSVFLKSEMPGVKWFYGMWGLVSLNTKSSIFFLFFAEKISGEIEAGWVEKVCGSNFSLKKMISWAHFSAYLGSNLQIFVIVLFSLAGCLLMSHF